MLVSTVPYEATSQKTRPAYAQESIKINISPDTNKLKLEIIPESRVLRPGSECITQVRMLDPSGAPLAGGEIAFFVVNHFRNFNFHEF